MSSFRGRQIGLTMIELMIAMLLGLVLMGGVVQIFVGTKQSYNLQEAQSRLQENGRLAMHFLPRDIRLADFNGCRSRQQYSTSTNVIADPIVAGTPVIDPLDPASIWDPNGGITGSDNVIAGTQVGGTNVVAGTDIINLQFGGSCGGHLVGNMKSDNANIQIDANNTCNLQQNWPFMITDCVTADIARRENKDKATTPGEPGETVAHGGGVNSLSTAPKLSKAYQSDAEIFSIQSITYFIAQNAIGNNSLFRRDNATGISEEIVEGVENMQVLYGEDTDSDGTANYFVPASNVVAMQTVVSVKVSLLSRSLSDVNVASKPLTYTYNGATATAVDRQLRKVFTSTVTLRNRLP
ncbi:MAG: PilW family protein [Methylococcaceae bacterium]|nr:PilW family protein [Methylococcaceae bacterium]